MQKVYNQYIVVKHDKGTRNAGQYYFYYIDIYELFYEITQISARVMKGSVVAE
jgi:hypothetical protein